MMRALSPQPAANSRLERYPPVKKAVVHTDQVDIGKTMRKRELVIIS